MSPVAVSADRRFHRAHVKPARRRASRAIGWALLKYVVSVAALLAATYRVFVGVTSSDLLTVKDLEIRGNHRMATAEVAAIVDELRGENIVRADLDTWHDRLVSTPWIREASIRRVLPSTVEIVVAEREPIGIGRDGDALYLVDERGVKIDDYDARYVDLDLPIIDGLSRPGAAAPDDERSTLAARVIAALRSKPAIARRVSQIDVSNAHNAAVIVNGDPALIYVGEDQFLARLESYLGLAGALRERVPGIDYVDLRFDDRIFVRPLDRSRKTAGGAGRTTSGPANRKR